MIKITRVFTALLLTIACIAFQTNINASEDTAGAGLTAEDYRVKGFIAQKKGNLNEALTYYDKALSLGLKNAMIFNDIGIVCEEIGLFLKAEYYYRGAIDLDQKYLPSYMNLAYLYINKGFSKKAIKFLKKRYELGEYGDFWTNRAKQELLKIDPSSIKWINKLEKKRIRNASRVLEKEIVDKARNEFEEIVETSEAHYKKGRGYLEERKYALAEKEFKRALAVTPNNPKVIDALSFVYAKKGEWFSEKGIYDEAIAAYDLSLKVKPNNQEVLVRRDAVELELMKQKALHHLDIAKKMLSSGDFISAKEEIKKVLTIIPDD